MTCSIPDARHGFAELTWALLHTNVGYLSMGFYALSALTVYRGTARNQAIGPQPGEEDASGGRARLQPPQARTARSPPAQPAGAPWPGPHCPACLRMDMRKHNNLYSFLSASCSDALYCKAAYFAPQCITKGCPCQTEAAAGTKSFKEVQRSPYIMAIIKMPCKPERTSTL